ncbi:MAG: FAD-dependent oxidoreductase [Bacteroidota bacterium]
MTSQPNLSHWEKETFFEKIDVVVVGGGIVGLNAAIHLKELDPALRVSLVERSALPAGASTRNAGFACFGSLTELLDDWEVMGEDACFELLERRWEGLQLLRELVGDANMEYQSHGSYELFRHGEEESYKECCEKMDYINDRLADMMEEEKVFSVRDKELSRMGFAGVGHLIFNRLEGQIHPGKMMARLIHLAQSKGVQIINGLGIQELREDSQGVSLQTDAGWTIEAEQVLVATNGFATQLLPELSVRPARNQVMISRPIKQLPFQACFHYDKGYYYFRNVGNRLLLGGGRHQFGDEEYTDSFGVTKELQDHLEEMARELILPGIPFKVERWWSGILGVGPSKQPILRWVGPRTSVAVRLGGMGIAIGSSVGRQAAELLL